MPFIDHGLLKPSGHGTSIGVALLQPRSRGNLRLRSGRSEYAPVIDPGYLTDPEGADLATLVRGVRKAQQLYRAPALARYAGSPIEPAHDGLGDDALAQFVREQA